MALKSRNLHIPEQAIGQLQQLIAHADVLPKILGALKEAEVGVSSGNLLETISETVGIPPEHTKAIAFALESLRVLRGDRGGDEDVFESIASSLNLTIRQQWIAKKSAILAALSEYTDDNVLALTFKAQKLSVFHEKVYTDCEIITDARPVFDAKGERVVEFVITHSLVTTFNSNRQTQRIHLAMDAADVLDLRKACDRAIVKAKTLKHALAANPNWKIQVLREDEG